ncbi:class I SAM-dependent methyltransferase [Streptomyces sp. NPDC059092]|uniref:class I SAM-dependent methyltransferase n=1 Tax=Streptomyces sp. NPDC059092 TaxID=3346725 RepID=UPI003674628B
MTDAVSGDTFYDLPGVSEEYLRRRSQTGHPNDLMEEPYVRELMGPVTGRSFLDLGCGDARFGRALLDEGAERYVGVDASRRLLEHAPPATDRLRVQHATLRDWRPEPGSADVVTARMVLHYLPDLGDLLERVRSALRPGGAFVLSVEHPTLTSCYDLADQEDFPRSWLVRDYFRPGPRPLHWLGGTVVKHHRSIEDYLTCLEGAGLRLAALREGRPRNGTLDEETLRARQHVPMYLIVKAVLPADRAGAAQSWTVP